MSPRALKLSEEGEGFLRIRGADAAIAELLDEHSRLELRETELLSEGATEVHPTCELSLVRMRLRSIPGSLAHHLRETTELRKLNRVAPHPLTIALGEKK